jgi:carbon-monoxide dehydrogenase medium subunit
MKPPPFDYHDPRAIDDVLDLLAEHTDEAALLAGGQSLLPLLNMRLARPEVVVDLNRVEGLDAVEITDGAVSLGAMARLGVLEHDARVAEALPVLTEAISWVAHPQIRVRTTVGGTCCHADPSAEVPTVAVATGATMHLRTCGGERAVAAEDFFETVFTTVKEPDELLVRVDFPRRPGMVIGYDEISRRHGDFPFVGLCLGVGLVDGVVAEVRAAAAGVANRPVHLPGLESALLGRPLGEAVEDAAEAASADIEPPADLHGSTAFRRGLLRTLVRRLSTRLEEPAR